ncbi:ComEA family DNA-binding protein [Thaumasiovibrio sp. DFM-14]|uniref:ComEA family DNA-binding protein n=1 Tax=Thaumasiovibrio sp. DFM-14 TaxID=3384792 RepID=UPI00399F4A09
MIKPGRTLAMSALLIGALMGSAAFATDSVSSQQTDIKVNINSATLEELDKLLIGIGPDKAQAIIDYRNAHGQFATAEELINVKGIGASTVKKNAQRIVLD